MNRMGKHSLRVEIERCRGSYQIKLVMTRGGHLSLTDLFSDKRRSKDQDREKLIDELYRQIGQMKVDLDWLKKSWS